MAHRLPLPLIRMPAPITRCVLIWLMGLVCLGGRPSAAQSASPEPPNAATGTSAPQSSADVADDERLQPAEPDYRLVNLPTTLRLPLHRSNFEMTHRFNGNLEQGTLGDQASSLFGLDEGAVTGFEYRFAVLRHVEAAVYRTSFDRTIQFYGKYDAMHQGGASPLSLSALVSVEGSNNFKEHRAPSLGASISRTVSDRLAMYATPIWVHNSAAALGADRDTVLVGVGSRVRLLATVYVVGEASPRVGGYAPGKAEVAFGIEKRAGLHLFQLNFTNMQQSTFGQIARGGFPNTWYLGFNLARKFF
jgi:hypothetical protein